MGLQSVADDGTPVENLVLPAQPPAPVLVSA